MARFIVRNLTSSRFAVPAPIGQIIPPNGTVTVSVASSTMDESDDMRSLVANGYIAVTATDDPETDNSIELLPNSVAITADGPVKLACRVATVADIASLAGGAPDTVDDVGLSEGDRILVMSQTSAEENGLYEVVDLGTGADGTWARTEDTIAGAMLVAVSEGTANANTLWLLATPDPITVDVTTLSFVQGTVALTAAAPANVTKAAAAVGVATTAARADHKHDITTAAPAAAGVAAASGEGVAASLARSDHTHQSNTAPANVTKAAAAIGTSGEPARADHKHDITTGVPVDVGTANAEGSAASLARSDHVHDLGAGIASPLHTAVVDADGLGVASVIRKSFAAAAAGTADDVTIYSANAPFAFRILDAFVLVETNIGGSTLTLRSATAGGGSALSDALDSATTGVKRNEAITSTPTVAANGTLVVRRSDRGVAGEVVLLIQRT